MNKNAEKNNIIYLLRNKGYALLEIIFYISLFAIFSIAVIDSMIVMAKSFKEVSIQMGLAQGGNMMERISREIRGASSINTISANSLKLNTTDSAGASKTVQFSLSGSDVRLLENDVFIGNLNTGNLAVTALTFTQINTTVGSAVKVLLTVRSTSDSQNRNENFYDTVVLRGDY